MFRSSRLFDRTVSPPEPAGDLAPWFLLGSSWIFLGLIIGDLAGIVTLSPATWYLARSSGFVLFGLSWLTTVSGLAITTKLLARVVPGHLLFSLHRYAVHLWLGFLMLHIGSLALDPTVAIGLRALVVPFASTVREPWTGFGVLATELTLVIGGSAGLRRLVGFRTWRALHWLAFPAFALGLAHGIGGGSDSGNPAARAMYLVAALTVFLMACYRLLRGRARDAARASRQPPLGVANRPRAIPDNDGDRFRPSGGRTWLDAPVDRRR